MNLEEALKIQKDSNGGIDILELLSISFEHDFNSNLYYTNKIKALPDGEYFLSDLDGTFFRGVLQKEAFSVFIKMIRTIDATRMDIDLYYKFLEDYKVFNTLEKKAYNKEIEYFDYLNAGMFLLIKHAQLIEWDEYIQKLTNNFTRRRKVKPYRFSLDKMKEILISGKKFMFISGAPEFIFEIYLDLLKKYIGEKVGSQYVDHIYGFGSHICLNKKQVTPLWGKNHKIDFIKLLKEKQIFTKIIGGMGDTRSDFGISHNLDKGAPFFFVNPERKVIEQFDSLQKEGINYEIVIERKDLLCTIEKENINILDI